MTPEEIEVIVKAVGETLKTEESSNGPIYILLSIIVTVAPFIFRYFKKMFVTSIEKVMEVHVKQIEEMHSIMHLHIDELQGVKNKQSELEDKHNELDKRVIKNTTLINSSI